MPSSIPISAHGALRVHPAERSRPNVGAARRYRAGFGTGRASHDKPLAGKDNSLARRLGQVTHPDGIFPFKILRRQWNFASGTIVAAKKIIFSLLFSLFSGKKHRFRICPVSRAGAGRNPLTVSPFRLRIRRSGAGAPSSLAFN